MSMLGIMADSKQQGPPFSPEQLTGLRLWLDASDTATITHTANAVSQWNDKSGNNFHVAQGTGANQPITGTTNINGKNTILFNGTTQFLTRAPTQLVDPTTGVWSCFSVNKPAIVTGVQSIVDQDGVGANRIFHYRLNAASSQCLAFNTVPTAFTENGPTGNVAGTAYYFSSIREATQVTTYRNGVGAGGSTPTSGTNATGTYNVGIGAGRTGGTPLTWINGEIGEILVYNVALSATDRGKVDAYLKTKWGL